MLPEGEQAPSDETSANAEEGSTFLTKQFGTKQAAVSWLTAERQKISSRIRSLAPLGYRTAAGPPLSIDPYAEWHASIAFCHQVGSQKIMYMR